MFKWYGIFGIFLILLVELNFIFKIEPFASWYFPIIWLGYILVIDALVYSIKRNSLINNRFKQFLVMLVLSAIFWWTFEFINNLYLANWEYSGLGGFGSWFVRKLFGTLSFATVVPAFFETFELLRTIHLFDDVKLDKKLRIKKRFLFSMMIAGILCFALPAVFPEFAFPLIWLSFFLLLDPFNYLHGRPSIIGHVKNRNVRIPLLLSLAGLICGFLWEFWNYWAVPKWAYTLPSLVDFWRVFEMPILGYLGYLPFAWELYAMYHFSILLYKGEARILKNLIRQEKKFLLEGF